MCSSTTPAGVTPRVPAAAGGVMSSRSRTPISQVALTRCSGTCSRDAAGWWYRIPGTSATRTASGPRLTTKPARGCNEIHSSALAAWPWLLSLQESASEYRMSARTGEHRYFLGAALVLTFLVLWAFSFEYRDLMHPSQFTVLVQVHGLVMFAWVGLFLTQAALIVWHRPLWHRR